MQQQGAKTMKRFGVARVEGKNLPVQGLGLGKPPALLAFGGELQVLPMVGGQL
jgi:hypothetical protein